MYASIVSVTGNYAQSVIDTSKQDAFDAIAALADSTIWVMCITTPRDSAGTEGEPLLSQWINRNF